ncbi:hypothetical protein JCM10213v2_004717 [Rhodosporidiobolus nylandii]
MSSSRLPSSTTPVLLFIVLLLSHFFLVNSLCVLFVAAHYASTSQSASLPLVGLIVAVLAAVGAQTFATVELVFFSGGRTSGIASSLAVRLVGLAGSLVNWTDLRNPLFRHPRATLAALLLPFFTAVTASMLFWVFVPAGHEQRAWAWWLVLPVGDIAFLTALLVLHFLPSRCHAGHGNPFLPSATVSSSPSTSRSLWPHLEVSEPPLEVLHPSLLSSLASSRIVSHEVAVEVEFVYPQNGASADSGYSSAPSEAHLARQRSEEKEEGLERPASRWSTETSSRTSTKGARKILKQQRQSARSGLKRLFGVGGAGEHDDSTEELARRQVRIASDLPPAPQPAAMTESGAGDGSNSIIGLALSTPLSPPPGRAIRLRAFPPPPSRLPVLAQQAQPAAVPPTAQEVRPSAPPPPGFAFLGPVSQRLEFSSPLPPAAPPGGAVVQQASRVPVPAVCAPTRCALPLQTLPRSGSSASSSSAYSTATSPILSAPHSRSSSLARSVRGPEAKGDTVFPPRLLSSTPLALASPPSRASRAKRETQLGYLSSPQLMRAQAPRLRPDSAEGAGGRATGMLVG